MISFKRAFVAATIGLASIAAHATPESDANWEKLKAFTHQQKNDAVAAGKKLLADTDKKIAELSASTRNATAETKAAHEKNMKDLLERKKAAQAELDKLEKSGSDVWDATKTGFSNAGKELAQAYDKAVAASKR